MGKKAKKQRSKNANKKCPGTGGFPCRKKIQKSSGERSKKEKELHLEKEFR